MDDKWLSGAPVRRDATIIDRLRIEALWFLGSIFNLLRLPGLVKPMQVYDALTNTQIQVVTNHLFTVISVNGNDYYFRRLDGEYDGSGKQV